jgi:hypothetical protein
MKKTKKFDDGGSTGGHFEMNGDSGRYVEDAPVAAGIGPRVGGPMGAGIQDAPNIEAALAGLGRSRGMGAGIAGMGGDSEVGYTDRPDVTARPMGLMVPRGRGIGAGMAGMKKGGAVKKAKGGSIRGCGCESRGKTKGRFV